MRTKECDKYLDLFLYQVETDKNGNKQVHIDGYCYWNDESYQLVQGTFCYVFVPILETCDSEEANELVEEVFEEIKQYQKEVSEQEVLDYYKGATELRIDCVSEDTPDGLYVDYA
ncbi:MAG: hypothetical protein J6X18_00675 [Bacteroidales bacterium]|nr:hypothetical protein [Bacteroidales bacterium]